MFASNFWQFSLSSQKTLLYLDRVLLRVLGKYKTVCSRSFGNLLWQNWQKFNKNNFLQKNNFNSVENFSFKKELPRSALPCHETRSDGSTNKQGHKIMQWNCVLHHWFKPRYQKGLPVGLFLVTISLKYSVACCVNFLAMLLWGHAFYIINTYLLTSYL